MPTITLCMVLKNEAHRMRNALDSVKDVVDEIVVIDTGSSDDTIAIAKEYGAKVFEHPWNDNVSFMRNIALNHATGDWILVLDGDEHVQEGSSGKLKELAAQDVGGFYVRILNLKKDAAKNFYHRDIRFYRNYPGLEYDGWIHQNLLPSLKKHSSTFPHCDVVIVHSGYHELSKDKQQRNLRILTKELAADSRKVHLHYYIGREYYCHGEFRKAVERFSLLLNLRPKQDFVTVDALLTMGMCRVKLGEEESAIMHFKKALEIKPNSVDARLWLAETYWKLGSKELCKQEYERYIVDYAEMKENPDPFFSVFHYPDQTKLAQNRINRCQRDDTYGGVSYSIG